ncbi:MAG: OmpA family protein [Alphaproteobacteria bacterium]|nr:OmpA family protein [Alphaproteobacteria bacterium]
MKYFNIKLLVALLLSVAVVASPATAREMFGESPTEEQLINALKPAKKKMKFRSIRPTIGGKSARHEEAKPEKRSVSLTINFEFNSATLTEKSKKSLETLGSAFNSKELSAFSFQVIGHTDSKGSADYNLELSKRRADSVKKYLVELCDISQKRLESTGMGEKEPTDKNNTASAKNRRVEIVNVGK